MSEQSMGEKPNQRPSPDEYDAMLAEISEHLEEVAERGGPVGPGGNAYRLSGGDGPGGASGSAVASHWTRVGLLLFVDLALAAVLGIYVNFVVALFVGLVLTGLLISFATQGGYRKGLGYDKAADIPLGVGAMLAVLALAYFAPIFYLSSAGKGGVTTDVLVTAGSRDSASCQAVLPNGKTAKVTCLNPGDRNRLSPGHYRVVYDPDGHTRAWAGTKSDLPVALGGGLVVGGLVVCGVGAGLGVWRAARGKNGWRPGPAAH
ncbi:hypothetical protein KGQ20_36240 [Catenulispora sp. NF23]|uniref:hypothetical protein n=1 Tax=Catenulispora pinistramenti TaxID=2705254 RepID=UPI001BA6E67C|nr:hypothetical protein [Catenulispora pinistramenti]MBS2538216.1 hypothetical protein [Catenulispora pinistramenti]